LVAGIEPIGDGSDDLMTDQNPSRLEFIQLLLNEIGISSEETRDFTTLAFIPRDEKNQSTFSVSRSENWIQPGNHHPSYGYQIYAGIDQLFSGMEESKSPCLGLTLSRNKDDCLFY